MQDLCVSGPCVSQGCVSQGSLMYCRRAPEAPSFRTYHWKTFIPVLSEVPNRPCTEAWVCLFCRRDMARAEWLNLLMCASVQSCPHLLGFPEAARRRSHWGQACHSLLPTHTRTVTLWTYERLMYAPLPPQPLEVVLCPTQRGAVSHVLMRDVAARPLALLGRCMLRLALQARVLPGIATNPRGAGGVMIRG